MSLRRTMDFPLSNFYDQMSRMLYDFPEPMLGPMKSREQGWVPAIETSETEDEVCVKAALPGLNPEDINVEVEDKSVILSGESREESREERESGVRSEFFYGSFYRRIPLATPVKTDEAKAEFKNGVLRLTLPKREESRHKRIEITAE